jgi:hypothetical protein
MRGLPFGRNRRLGATSEGEVGIYQEVSFDDVIGSDGNVDAFSSSLGYYHVGMRFRLYFAVMVSRLYHYHRGNPIVAKSYRPTRSC